MVESVERQVYQVEIYSYSKLFGLSLENDVCGLLIFPTHQETQVMPHLEGRHFCLWLLGLSLENDALTSSFVSLVRSALSSSHAFYPVYVSCFSDAWRVNHSLMNDSQMEIHSHHAGK